MGWIPAMTRWLDGSRTRRDLLRAGLLAPVGLAGTSAASAWAQQTLPPTASCPEATPTETEGPYFKPHSPERSSLREPGIAGTTFVLTGHVLSTACEPVAHALLDFWHADDGGAYDNGGFRLRGHQFTDEQGRYVLETILPGVYVGRTRHIHVKLQAPKGRVVTTQLYFPDEPRNIGDSLFRPKLLIAVRADAASKIGRFDFVVR
jgi:protocatechuate 3,4-dioxygenase beta subunit